MTGRAWLDPASGLIVGYVDAARRPPPVDFVVGGGAARRVLASARLIDLPESARERAATAPETAAHFAVRLPQGIVGADLSVRTADGPLLDHRWRDGREMRRYMEGALMADSVTLESLSFRVGVFHGRIRDHARNEAGGGAAPRVRLFARGEEIVAEAKLTAEEDGRYAFTAELPPAALGDGVVAIQFRLDDGSVIGAYQIASGAALADDLAAEVGALRAELDQLKRAFRDTFAAGALRRDERPMIVAEALAQVDHLLEMRDRMDRRQDAMAASELMADDEADWDVDQ
ncbi:MAG: hypothetical protein AAFN79_06465 [Pseudomonadota bacterium]